MTTETSNARGEVVAWQYRRIDQEDGIGPWIGCSESDAEIIRRNTFHEVRPLYAAAPPPAAARGDVRGLGALAKRVQYADTHAQVSKDDAGEFVCLPPWLWLEIRDAAAEALAAEGVQAGEVVELRRQLYLLGGERDRYKNLADRASEVQDRMQRAIDEARSQQPEARGGVDGELSHADLCRLSRVFNNHNELHLTQDRRINEWLGKRIAEALTGERNG